MKRVTKFDVAFASIYTTWKLSLGFFNLEKKNAQLLRLCLIFFLFCWHSFLGGVVDYAEQDDGYDVLLGREWVCHVVERVAHREVALEGDGHGEVDPTRQPDLGQREKNGQDVVVDSRGFVLGRELRHGEEQDAEKWKEGCQKGVFVVKDY